VNRVFGDPVDVWVVNGRPGRFTWHGRLYTIRRILQHWVPETGVEVWRVEAGQEKVIGIYELRHDLDADEWTLSRMWG
jgi:hypothetical protein